MTQDRPKYGRQKTSQEFSSLSSVVVNGQRWILWFVLQSHVSSPLRVAEVCGGLGKIIRPYIPSGRRVGGSLVLCVLRFFFFVWWRRTGIYGWTFLVLNWDINRTMEENVKARLHVKQLGQIWVCLRHPWFMHQWNKCFWGENRQFCWERQISGFGMTAVKQMPK